MLKKYEVELDNLKAVDNFRKVQYGIFKSPTSVEIDNKNYLVMNSNNYLGISFHQKVIDAGIEAARLYGTGSTGSRLTSGSFHLFEKLEKELAEFKNMERTLVFNNGYVANLCVISTLFDENDLIFSDALNHASIIDGIKLSRAKKLIYNHNDMEHLEKLLKNVPMNNKVIISDGVFSMDGDICKIEKLHHLAKKYNALLMIDDAHGTGVLGGGYGILKEYNLEGKIDIYIGTLSKAMGSCGGFVCVNKILYDYLINKGRAFIYSTALSPFDIATSLEALNIIKNEPIFNKRLQANINFLCKALKDEGIFVKTESAIFPIIVNKNDVALKIAEELYEHNILVSAIRPPTVPENEARLRLTVNAFHTEEELANFAKIFGKIYKKYVR